MEARALLTRWPARCLAAALLAAAPAAQAQTQCLMPNGVAIRLSQGPCPADAQRIDPASGKPVAAPTAPTGPAAADVRAAEFGAAWPFTVPSGRLGCEYHHSMTDGRLLTFTAGGKTYALNGLARGAAPRRGWLQLEEVWRPNAAIPGTRVPIGPMIQRAMRVCK